MSSKRGMTEFRLPGSRSGAKWALRDIQGGHTANMSARDYVEL